ncbi:MAG: hypothetical protein ACLSF3_03045, partial [Anaerobutyricum hallii]|uniref:hypothetical protein n=1 Tax=Anaerobutyricum hallii TaxID=39488 RepID=UPI0039935E55
WQSIIKFFIMFPLYTVANFKKYKKYIKNGNLQESMTQSKSIFDTFIDGITESTQDYLAEQSADSAESTTQSN